MQVWEITLPLRDNDGKPCRAAHRAYQAWLLNMFGGFSERNSVGQWKDDDGSHYSDPSIVYTVASDPRFATEEGFKRSLTSVAAKLFPDQKAFYVAHVGQAWINRT